MKKKKFLHMMRLHIDIVVVNKETSALATCTSGRSSPATIYCIATSMYYITLYLGLQLLLVLP